MSQQLPLPVIEQVERAQPGWQPPWGNYFGCRYPADRWMTGFRFEYQQYKGEWSVENTLVQVVRNEGGVITGLIDGRLAFFNYAGVES